MKKTILKRLLPYLYPYKKHIFIVLSLSLINVILSLINPILIGKAIDIANDGSLIVKNSDGSTKILNSGDITIRKVNE